MALSVINSFKLHLNAFNCFFFLNIIIIFFYRWNSRAIWPNYKGIYTRLHTLLGYPSKTPFLVHLFLFSLVSVSACLLFNVTINLKWYLPKNPSISFVVAIQQQQQQQTVHLIPAIYKWGPLIELYDPLSPKSDKHQISPCNTNAL